MAVRIVQATQENIQDLVELNGFVQGLHHARHPDIFKPSANKDEVAGFFRKQLRVEANHFFLACFESKAAGYIWAAVHNMPESAFKYARRELYIHQIAVHPEFRREGVGSALIKAVDSLAEQEGIRHIELDSWAFNTDAHAFFQRHGFEMCNLRMWRKLESASDS